MTTEDRPSVDETLNSTDERKNGTQDTDIMGLAQPRGENAGDDGDDNDDSGNDVDESSAGDAALSTDVAVPDETKMTPPNDPKPIVPGNVFQQYQTMTADEVAARFTPKHSGPGIHGAPDNGVRLSTLAPDFNATTDVRDTGPGAVVAGASAVVDVQAEQAALAALNARQRAHGAGADTSVEQAAYAAAIHDLVSVRAPMPVLRRLNPLSRTVQDQQ